MLVARLNVIRRNMLRDLHQRIVAASPTTKLGLIVTGAEVEAAGYYGYGYGYGQTSADALRGDTPRTSPVS